MKTKAKKFFQSDLCQDLLCVLLFILTYILIIAVKTENGRYLSASSMDFNVQHYTIPEYLRNLFYETGDLLPDFSFHLGAGQNIYTLSYYGLLSPMLLLSYLFPFVTMIDFIIVYMSLCVIASVVLFYFFFKKNGYRRMICFLCAFLLLCAAPLILHSARHIMFVSYMPFLILGLYGVDRYVEKKKSFLLILSVSLMIFTSYYFSIPAMAALFVYGLFKYVRNNGFRFRSLTLFAAKSIVPYVVSVLIAAILILPTFAVFFMGRSDNVSTVSLLELFIPKQYMLHKTYSMGLTYVCFIGCICMLFARRIENRILSAFLLLISIFPFFNYLLNVFIYVSAKVLIPFIPLTLINTADFISEAYEKCKRSSILKPKKVICALLGAYLVFSSFALCLKTNRSDPLITRADTKADFSEYHADLLENSLLEDGVYRVNTSLADAIYVNRVVNTNEYKTTVYSSIFNGTYRKVYRDLFENPLNDRNEFFICASNNLIFQMYMGEKYIYSRVDPGFMYEAIENYGDVTLYCNPYVLPIGYVTNRIMSKNDFSALSYPDNMLNLLGTAVVYGKESTVNAKKTAAVSDLDYEVTAAENLSYQKTKEGYVVRAKQNAKLTLTLKDTELLNKLLFIDFSLRAKEADLSVTVNGICNTLTAKDWKYYNQNSRFAYVISNDDNVLEFTFDEGEYEISDVSASVLDFNAVKDIYKTVDAFVIDRVSGDTMTGKVKATQNGVFLLSIPYDEGFTVYVDGKQTDYYLANEAFIGFDISEGEHEIVITYKAPLKTAGLAISCIGVALCTAITVYENRKKEKTWN